MEFSLVPALAAGFLGAVAMTAMMQMATAAGMTDMPPMTLIQGAMVTDDRRLANAIGAVTHLLMMGTLVFGLLYAVLFTAIDSAGWVTGAVIGAVHGVVAGMAMAMMGAMHPRMEPAGETVTTSGGRLVIQEPGLFAKNYGPMTPMGLVAGHVVYGVVVALVYGALV